RRRLSRLAPRRTPARAWRRDRCTAPGRVRPHARARGGPPLRRRAPGARLPPGRRGRRDRRQPCEPGPVLVREPADGRERARAGAPPRGGEALDRRHRLRLPEVRADPVSRGRLLGRFPGGDERALRSREEGAAGRSAGVPGAVRAERDLPAADEPVRPARQLRPRDLARDPGADPEDARVSRRGRPLGRRLAEPRVPVRRGLRRGVPARGRAIRRTRSRQRRHGRRDDDPRDGGARGGADRVLGRDRLGHLDAERPAAPQPRRGARQGAVRVRSAHLSPGRPRAHDRGVPRAIATQGARAARGLEATAIDQGPILVLYWWHDRSEMRRSVERHLHAVDHVADEVVYVNADRADPDPVRERSYAGVLLHTTFLWLRCKGKFDRYRRAWSWLRDLDCPKIALPQDEFNHSAALDEWLDELGVDHVFSNFDEPAQRLLYPRTFGRARFSVALTGYIDEDAAAYCRTRAHPLAERPLDVVYRTAPARFWLGRGSLLKTEIGSEVLSRAERHGLDVDISTKWRTRSTATRGSTSCSPVARRS